MTRIRVLAVLLILLFIPVVALPAYAASNDDIVIGQTTKVLPRVEGQENLIKNGGFEELEDDGKTPTGWTSRSGYGLETSAAHIVTDNEAHSGKNAIRIKGDKDALRVYPFVSQSFKTMGKATYQLSLWLKKDGGKDTATVKLEFWPEMLPGASTIAEHNTFLIKTTDGEWQQVLFNFEAPFTAKTVSLLARCQSNAETVYFDDIEVYMVKPPQALDVETDGVFYYPDQTGEGTATANVLTDFFTEAEKGHVEFSLRDGDKVLKEQEKTALNEESKVTFSYDLSLLKEKKKEYTIRAVLYDENGKEMMTVDEPVYKFDRPKFLGADGVYRVDGEVFNPVLAYHTYSADYEKCAEVGINVVQGGVTNLEEAEKYGLKVMVTLYPGMQPAGHSSNAAKTKETVEAYKDDPRVYAWAIMDEPYLNLPDPDDDLRESYRIIREIDDNHPVYICEATPDNYERAVKYCDILAPDPYLPGSNSVPGKMNTTHVMEYIERAKNASNGLKPVQVILQAFKWYKYMPDGDAERHMIYQAFLGGVSALGYYSISDPVIEGNVKIPLHQVTETDIWEGMKGFAELEQKMAFEHFVEKKHPGFNHYEGTDYIYHSFVKDGDIYMLIMNQSITDSVSVEVPLTSFDDKITVEGYKATVHAGAEKTTVKGEKTLKAELKPYAAVIYRITPDKPISINAVSQDDFWKLTFSQEPAAADKAEFTDLASHEWAKEAISAMYAKNIVNDKGEGIFAPGENVTRGDFAMFLIRALDLSADAKENFDDVDENAEYAKEIAIGKALGILQGVGDNKFNPEEAISRQDLMTICTRGMELIRALLKEEDLSKFSDGNKVADYAKSAISKMVGGGIILGNADGTLNPLGNTTRAEAAVIMSRIVQWK